MKLGEKILNYRKKLGLSQEELGDKVGVSRQTVSKWEIGQTIPELEKMILLAKEFGTTIDELVKDEECSKENENRPEEKKAENFIGKTLRNYNKAIKIIAILLLIIFVLFMSKVAYRYILICAFQKQANSFYDLPHDCNYRLEVSEFEEDRGMTYGTHEYIAYYAKDNIFKKEMINSKCEGGIERIQYLNCNTQEYLDVDCINKTYTDNRESLELKEDVELTEQLQLLISDMLKNIDNMHGWKNKLKIAFNFDYRIAMAGKNEYALYIADEYHDYYLNKYLFFGEKGIRYQVRTVDEENRSCSKTLFYILDLNVVINESLTAKPDVTGYTRIEN